MDLPMDLKDTRLARYLKARPRVYRLWERLKRVWRLPLPWGSPTSPRALRRHAREALHADRAVAGESGHLREVLSRLDLRGGYLVDIAAGDGVEQSCTLFLFRDPVWGGLAVEADPVQFTRLSAAYVQFQNVRLARHRVTPSSVVELLEAHAVPRDFEFLNLDIDSWDLEVADALLRAFRPKVLSVEVNEKIPPPVYFTVLYREDHVWRRDHFYGCSLVAAAEVVRARGYVLESLHYNNAFFVRRDLAAGLVEDRPVEEAYERGYRSRPDRKGLFPWNQDMEDLLHRPPREVVSALEERFRAYEGRFVIELREAPGPPAAGLGDPDALSGPPTPP